MIQFLKKLFKTFLRQSNKDFDKYTVHENEPIARYIFSKSHISRSIGKPKAAAYLPNPKNQETSVFRTMHLKLQDVFDIGNSVGKKRNQSLKGWGSIVSKDVLKTGLNITPEIKSHIRHANIIDWPEKKSEQKLLALKIAENSVFIDVSEI